MLVVKTNLIQAFEEALERDNLTEVAKRYKMSVHTFRNHFKAWDSQVKARKLIKALERKGGKKFRIDPQVYFLYKSGFYELQNLGVIELKFLEIENENSIILILKGE